MHCVSMVTTHYVAMVTVQYVAMVSAAANSASPGELSTR